MEKCESPKPAVLGTNRGQHDPKTACFGDQVILPPGALAVAIDGSKVGTHLETATVGFAAQQFSLDAYDRCEIETAHQCLSGEMLVDLPVQRCSGRAELYAFLQVLMHALQPGLVFSDYQTLLDDLRRGRK